MDFIPPRILIVEDDADSLANLSDILGDCGFETITATDGVDALAQFDSCSNQRGKEIDLCLIDFKMPRMNGLELLSNLKARFPGLPVIMMTAYAGEDGVDRAVQAGIRNVMRKPVDIKSLLALIDDALVEGNFLSCSG